MGEDCEQEPFPWDIGIYDAHCHPTDTMSSIDDIPAMKARVLTVMGTRAEDQKLVASVADRIGLRESDLHALPEGRIQDHCMLPSFARHPWFSHFIYDDTENESRGTVDKAVHYKNVLTPSSDDEGFLNSLPDLKPLSSLLSETKVYLEKYPLALVGELGLDRSFRIPENWLPGEQNGRDGSLTPGGREGRKLSPYRVQLSHQKKVLKAQLQVAGEMQRAVSVHSVQAHGAVLEVLRELWKGHEKEVLSKRQQKKQAGVKPFSASEDSSSRPEKQRGPKPYPPRICMHSYSGPAEHINQFLHPSIPAEIFFSFSSVINLSNPTTDKAEESIKVVPDDKILIESDLHCAGERMDGLLEDIARKVCQLKGWELRKGVEQLSRNWMRFAFGDIES